MIDPPSIQTQILIFTLFGDYIEARGGVAWTPSLLRMLELLEVSERAARSTLSRMGQKGWLESERIGRYSRYRLTRRGKHIVDEGGARIFEPRRKEWDGHWHMVVYSVPEEKRHIRTDLRKRLGWLGFGQLAPGVWIAPNDRREAVASDLEDLEAFPYAVYFSDMHLNFASNAEIVERCWDLEGINALYREFLDRYEPLLKSYRRDSSDGKPLSPEASFQLRFWVALEYSQFPRRDPNLPPELLPKDWLGTRANEVFYEFRRLLAEPTEAFISDVLSFDPVGA